VCILHALKDTKMSLFKSNMLEIGQKCRVICNFMSRRALISDLEERDLCSVVYCDEVAGFVQEESNIPISRISSLEEFEKRPVTAPEECKQAGNKLFQQKDYCAASEFYRRGIMALQRPISVGAQVAVYSDDLRDCTIGSVDFEDEQGMWQIETADGKEIVLPSDALLVLPDIANTEIGLLRACLLNLAKASEKLGRHGWGVRNAGQAFAVALLSCGSFSDRDTPADERASAEKTVLDSITLRVQALLAASRPGLAMSDVEVLESMCSGHERAKVLRTQVETFRKQRKMTNKKLARNVAAWVEESMRVAGELGVQMQTPMEM